MEVKASHYNRFNKEGSLEFTYEQSTGKIKIRNTENGVSVFPFFDYAFSFFDYILVKSNDCWGLLDKELRTILPTVFTHLYPVKLVKTNEYIEQCNNPFDLEDEISKPYNDEGKSHFFLSHEYHTSYDLSFGKSGTERIFEIVNISKEMPSFFIAERSKEIYLLSLEDRKIEKLKAFYHSFCRLFHLEDDLFLCDENGTLRLALYHKNFGFVYQVLQVKKYNDNSYSYVTYFSDYKLYKNGYFAAKNEKWGLYHKEIKRADVYNRTIFEHVSKGFFFSEAPVQTDDPNTFVGSLSDCSFIFKYDESVKVLLNNFADKVHMKKRKNFIKAKLQIERELLEKGKTNEAQILMTLSDRCVIATPFLDVTTNGKVEHYDIENMNSWSIMDMCMQRAEKNLDEERVSNGTL